MRYSELLSSYIDKSGLSLGEISLRLKNYGVSADRSYVSKLRNGVKPPASDDLNEALAKVLGQDPDNLIIAAYIDKAPPHLKSLLKKLDTSSLNQFKNLDEKHTGSIIKLFGDNSHLIEKSVEFKNVISKIEEVVMNKFDSGFDEGDDELIEVAFNVLQKEFGHSIDFGKNKDKFFNMLKNYGFQSTVKSLIDLRGHIDHSKEGSSEKLVPVNNFFRIPILGYIAAGEPILASDHIEDYMDIPNPGDYDPDELFMLKVKGDSMIGSRIFEGDSVLVKIQQEVENGEIAVVNVNGDEATLKKVKKLDNGQYLLLPSNDAYEPILVNHEGARIVGKVIQVIFEP